MMDCVRADASQYTINERIGFDWLANWDSVGEPETGMYRLVLFHGFSCFLQNCRN